MAMASTLQPVFAHLKDMLASHADGYLVSPDTANHYGLEGDVGPATLKAWKGKTERARIPIAWVTIEKAYVSFHLMAFSDPRVRKGLSPALAARLQGKTCFNFKTVDPILFAELDQLTTRALAAFEKAGYVVSRQRA
jgi:hypothetical protein